MGMTRIERWHGLVLTAGDLREFLGVIHDAPDSLVIEVEKAPYNDHLSDPGGDITLQAELPREPRTS